jgi:hypothetical protein
MVKENTKKNEDENVWLDRKAFVSALLGALLTLIGGIIYYSFEQRQLGQDIAAQVKWEVYENITDTFDNISSYDQAETLKKLSELDPNSSIQNSNFYYLTRHDLRDDFFQARVGNFNLLKGKAMRDSLEFYSLLHSVDENERQMESVFVNKIPLKVETVNEIGKDIAENTKRMRTMGAQVVGEIMYYYDSYDLALEKNDEPESSTDQLLNNLYRQVQEQVNGIDKGGLISAHEIATNLGLFNPNIFSCDSPLDVCGLATSHYLIMKTGLVNEGLPAYNGHMKK